MTTDDPTAPLDPVRRLHVMAAGIRGARVTEGVVDAPFDRVWAVMGDLEGEFGRFQPDMRSLRVLRRDGDRVAALARSRYGMRARFDGVIRPGWCWLQSRFLIVGMAAVADGAGATRVALTGGVRVPGKAALVPLGTRREPRLALARLQQRVDGSR
ncbi:hypothetical protein [Kitasatospora sp. NPDC085879]|jgi:hypothetical protein|uniref:hypothetical protein n=1 Tax=Kitasatospora sp. NPDC085879 TaxID=3154769 RepID=UPI000BB134E2|nr:hypothetical protein [Streptomyces sp. TLI_235]PBC79640.1 hypothetical protein BX265_4450 [Streptomyces sp. TLI_235]